MADVGFGSLADIGDRKIYVRYHLKADTKWIFRDVRLGSLADFGDRKLYARYKFRSRPRSELSTSSSAPIIHAMNAGQLMLSAARYTRIPRCAPIPYFLLFGLPSRLRKRPRTD